MAAMSIALRRSFAFILLPFACGGDQALGARLDAAEAVESSQRRQMDRLKVDGSQLVAEYDEQTTAFERATENFESAEKLATEASTSYASAYAAFTEAERNWRWMTYVVLAAATWDLSGEICAGVESTQGYRRRLGLVGNRGVCIDHSFAHALGGVNHPWNYVPLDCGVNSAYGAAFWSKFVDMPIEVLRGLAVSAIARLRCGSTTSAWTR
jgi:hypothetical protein